MIRGIFTIKNSLSLNFLKRNTNLIKSPIYKFCVSSPSPIQTPGNNFDEKIAQLEQQQPFFDRLIFFDPDVMASLPEPLQFWDPVVEGGKNLLVGLHGLGIPWWGVISLTCIMARTTIMPLIFIQLQRANKITAIAPVIIQLKKLIDRSEMSKIQKWKYLGLTSFQIIRQQQLKIFRVFLYNIVNLPIIITFIWSIRRLLVEESFKSTAFLWIPSFSAIDPYFIIPFTTVACYYWNFQRFITPQNKHTLVSKIRGVAQVLIILWLPILCNWPSAIAWYMMSNAIFSILQTTVIISPKFLRFVEPKMLIYQMMLRIIEYDKVQSEALVESIKKGEESLKDKQIIEDDLIVQAENMLEKLKLEHEERKLEKIKQKQNQFKD